MTDPDHAVVMWIEGGVDEADSGIMVRRIGRDASISEQKTIARTSSSRASGYPRMVRTGDRLLFLWTQTGDDGRVVSALSDYIGG